MDKRNSGKKHEPFWSFDEVDGGTRHRIAIHEAGHAVAACVVNAEIAHVEVRGTLERCGNTRHALPDGGAWDACLVSLAGPLASAKDRYAEMVNRLHEVSLDQYWEELEESGEEPFFHPGGAEERMMSELGTRSHDQGMPR